MISVFKKIKVRLSFIAAIRYMKIAVIALMAAGFIWLSWFLYENLYKPLTQAIVVAELRAKVALITVNRKDLEAILSFIDKRKQPLLIDWAAIPDPTSAVHIPPPASTSPPPPQTPAESGSSIKIQQ